MLNAFFNPYDHDVQVTLMSTTLCAAVSAPVLVPVGKSLIWGEQLWQQTHLAISAPVTKREPRQGLMRFGFDRESLEAFTRDS